MLRATFGDGQTHVAAKNLREKTNVLVRGRPSTCDDADAANSGMPCEEERETSIRFGLNNAAPDYLEKSLVANWARQPVGRAVP